MAALLLVAASLATFAGLGDLFESTLDAGSTTAIAATLPDDAPLPAFADGSADDVLPAEPPLLLAPLSAAPRAFSSPSVAVPRRLRLAGPDFERGPPKHLS
jgi:hypothetical protein